MKVDIAVKDLVKTYRVKRERRAAEVKALNGITAILG